MKVLQMQQAREHLQDTIRTAGWLSGLCFSWANGQFL